jgi:hypothetical protein
MDAMDDQKTNDQNLQVSSTGALYHVRFISLNLVIFNSNFFKFQSLTNEHFGIELTPLSYIPGGHIDNYLGNLDFFFIRESSSIREVLVLCLFWSLYY